MNAPRVYWVKGSEVAVGDVIDFGIEGFRVVQLDAGEDSYVGRRHIARNHRGETLGVYDAHTVRLCRPETGES